MADQQQLPQQRGQNQLRVRLIPGKSRLAIDVGNVISEERDTDDCNAVSKDLAERQSQARATRKCAESCRMLVRLFGKENTFILSKCRHRVQLATWQFLNNPVLGDDRRSFLEISGILPRNIVFSSKRSGGSAPVRLIPLLDGERNGPRTASGPVGKGSVAATLGLTHLIDDRIDCLLSFFWEGHVWAEMEKSALQLTKRKTKKRMSKRAEKQLDKSSSSFGLIHFGPELGLPSVEAIETFTVKAGKEASAMGVASFSENWTSCHGWDHVLLAFGLQPTVAEKGDSITSAGEARDAGET